MSATGVIYFLIAIIRIAVLGALIAVIAAVSGASAAISDEEDGLDWRRTHKAVKKITDKVQGKKDVRKQMSFFVSKKKIKLSEILL